ncbi:hypothetical protein Dimus_029474 [Dionaea muscipula]
MKLSCFVESSIVDGRQKKDEKLSAAGELKVLYQTFVSDIWKRPIMNGCCPCEPWSRA